MLNERVMLRARTILDTTVINASRFAKNKREKGILIYILWPTASNVSLECDGTSAIGSWL
jgi:hypothetical protein